MLHFHRTFIFKYNVPNSVWTRKDTQKMSQVCVLIGSKTKHSFASFTVINFSLLLFAHINGRLSAYLKCFVVTIFCLCLCVCRGGAQNKRF